ENWYLKGYVYTELAKSQVYKKLAPNAEFEALEAVKKSKELDTKKKFESDRINLLFDLSTLFYNKAITLYNDGVQNKKEANFPDALLNFEKFMECIDVLGSDQVIVTSLLDFNKVSLNDIYLYMGYSAQKCNQFEKAKANYDKIVLLNVPADQARKTGNPLAYIYYMDLLLANKDTLAARGVAQKGLEVYPENPDVVMAAIDLFSKMKKMSEMADLIEKVVQQNSNADTKMIFVLGQAYNNISKEYARKGYQSTADQYKNKAITYFEKVLQSNPSDKTLIFNTNYNLGVIYYNAGVNAYKQRSETNTTEYEFLFKKSLPYLEKAKEIDPKNKNVLNMLLKAYTSLNEKAKAEAIENELYK
ncbi:MAG: tetratricopeptide repeat protein, partial [Bacteroidales bacterium]